MGAEPAERLYTPEQIAQLCGLSRRAVYDAIKRGELGAFRLCSRLRISGEQLASGSSATPRYTNPGAHTSARGRALATGA